MEATQRKPLGPWIAVVLMFLIGLIFVWFSNGPKVALLNAYGVEAVGHLAQKEKVHTSGVWVSNILWIEFATPDGDTHRFRFEAASYPGVMERDPFGVLYLPCAPWVAWPAPDMRWSLFVLLFGLGTWAFGVLLTFGVWFEAGGEKHAWARRVDRWLEDAWERATSRF